MCNTLNANRIFPLLVFVIAATFTMSATAGEAAPVLSAQADERELTGDEAALVLGQIAENFKAHPHVKAHIRTEIDDLLGKRVEEGELLLSRPGEILRQFNRPTKKTWLLSGVQLQEYSARHKIVRIKDFSKAPAALALVQAAVTLEVKVLQAHFAIHVFVNTAQPKNLRLLLTKKTDGSALLAYKRIQVRLNLDQPLYSEIEYVPESGDRMVEYYTDIQVVPPPQAADFTLTLPPGTEQKIDVLEGVK